MKMNLNQLKILKKNNQISKKLGQNFLIDQNIIKKIIKIAKVKNNAVVEIGPGLGFLTIYLIRFASSLIAYEIDHNMVKILKETISSHNFTLINTDFLKADLNWTSPKILVANLPYYITSKILFKVFNNIDKFSKAVIMVQNEVADRLTAKIGSSNYNKLTVAANFFATLKKEFVLKPKAFFPKPKVKSAVLTLLFNKKNEIDSKKFLEFVKKSFLQRRKTLFNNWKEAFGESIANHLLTDLKLTKQVRPQELSNAIFEKAFNLFENIKHNN